MPNFPALVRQSALSCVLSTGAIAAALAAPGVASAEERAPTWEMSPTELEARGLGQYRGDPVPVPASMLRAPGTDEPQHAKKGTIFVNFDGATLSSGFDDSHTDTTQLQQLVGPFAPYGEGAKRDAVMEAVRADWAAYNITVTSTRPESGDYTMNMTGPSNPFGGGALGVAPVDCNDQQTHNNITFAFHGVNDQHSAAVTATTIGQEVAHSYGLEHVNEPGDIMNPYNAGGDASFNDRCIAIVQNVYCGPQHEAHCGTSTEQNAHQELLELFGTAAPDTAAPEVSITFPEDGAVFPTGSDVEIFVVATDDVAIATVELFNNGEGIDVDGAAPYTWEVSSIPDGEYELHVLATDTADNASMSNIVTISVGEAPPAGDSDGDSDGEEPVDDDENDDDQDDSGDNDGDDDDDDDGGAPGDFAGDAADTGCGCKSNGSQPPWLLLGLLPLALVRRRTSCLSLS